jgi:hypothetical protein
MEVERVTRITGRADARRAIHRMAKSFGRTTSGVPPYRAYVEQRCAFAHLI